MLNLAISKSRETEKKKEIQTAFNTCLKSNVLYRRKVCLLFDISSNDINEFEEKEIKKIDHLQKIFGLNDK